MPRAKKQHLKQRKDGRFKCVHKGKPFMGRTEDEAFAKRDEYIQQLARQEYIEKSPTVSDYALQWLNLHKANVSTKCYNDYAKQLEALFPYIGNKRLDKVTVDNAAAVWKHYEGYSASTIKRARMLYISLFDAAIENDLCRKNPFRGRFAQPPKAPSGSHRALTEEEISLILKTQHRLRLPVLLMLYCGLRRGEVMALTPADIQGDSLTVNKAVRFDGNKPIIAAPKTASGFRSVPIPDIILPEVQNAIASNPGMNLCATAHGQTMTDTAWKRAWDGYLHALSVTAGHPISIRPHDLRHTYCTLLVDAGISMKQAMQWMGHADEKMILKVYDHVTDTRTQTSIKLLNQNLSKVHNEVQPSI